MIVFGIDRLWIIIIAGDKMAISGSGEEEWRLVSINVW